MRFSIERNCMTFILRCLWQYHNLYFLKPFDAINDTLTASMLSRLDWSGKVTEIGCGDGVFNYVMHGGKFPLWFDRYILTDFKKNDIYDTHRNNLLKASKHLKFPKIVTAIDAKLSHMLKVKEIGFAESAVVSEYEKLPIKEQGVEKIFYYIPHGLKDHELAFKEVNRVLKPHGKVLILLYDEAFDGSFLCYKLSEGIRNSVMKNIFRELDKGRYAELIKMAKTYDEWKLFFEKHGFTIRKNFNGLSTWAWKIYDIQTRPFLKTFIRIFNFMPLVIRTAAKFIWMLCWYPFLVIFYILFSNEILLIDKKNCYFAFELEKIN